MQQRRPRAIAISIPANKQRAAHENRLKMISICFIASIFLAYLAI